MNILKTCIISCILVLSSLAWTGAQAGAVEDALDRGVLRVGLSSFTPWAMRAKDGSFIGFEADVARQMAEDMGLEAEIVPTAWDGIIPALLAKKFDLIIAGMSVTPQRNLQVNFSIPYAKIGLGVVVNRERMGHVSKPADLNHEDVVFALRRGTTPVEVVKAQMPKAQIRQFDDEAAALQEVLNGNADAWAAGAPGHTDAVLDHPDKLFIPFDEYLRSELSGIAIRKGDIDGLNFVNNWVRLRTNDGWLAERRKYWFEGREWKHLVGAE